MGDARIAAILIVFVQRKASVGCLSSVLSTAQFNFRCCQSIERLLQQIAYTVQERTMADDKHTFGETYARVDENKNQ